MVPSNTTMDDASRVNSLGIRVPARIRSVVATSKHPSEVLRCVNVLYCFNRRNRERQLLQQEEAEREAKRRRTEEARQQEEAEFPSDKFVPFTGSDGEYDIKGAVQIVDGEDQKRVPVVGYTFVVEEDMVLLVLQTHEDPSILYTALCSASLVPKDIITRLVPTKKKSRNWQEIEFDFMPVCRKDPVKETIVPLHLLTRKGPFRNRTCDFEMKRSLENGVVMSASDETKRTWFLAFALPFEKGRVRPASEVYEILTVDGKMFLQHPVTRTSSVTSMIAHLAMQAMIRDHGSVADTAAGILREMERFSQQAEVSSAIHRHCCLNVALGGTPSFSAYGRFIPCSVLLEANKFPFGSFTVTPCSCDIEQSEDWTKEVKAALKKLKGPNAGHNSKAKANRANSK